MLCPKREEALLHLPRIQKAKTTTVLTESSAWPIKTSATSTMEEEISQQWDSFESVVVDELPLTLRDEGIHLIDLLKADLPFAATEQQQPEPVDSALTVKNDAKKIMQCSSGKPKAQDHNKPDLVCQVCGKPASRHLFYGARACVSCRSFFRRARANSRYLAFACKDGSDCRLEGLGSLRHACSFCRY